MKAWKINIDERIYCIIKVGDEFQSKKEESTHKEKTDGLSKLMDKLKSHFEQLKITRIRAGVT